MNTHRRVLAITRHFWPVTTDDTLRLYHWLRYLRHEGARPTVLTPRWHTTWPSRIMCDEIPVHRLDYPPTHALRHGRYLRQLTHWLFQHLADFDLVYCDHIGIEASTLVNLRAKDVCPPTVFRYDTGADVDCVSSSASISAQSVASSRKAAVVLVQNSTAHQQLLGAGIKDTSILRACLSVPIAYDRSLDARRRARQILSEANHDLLVRSTDRVVVCPGELSRAWGVLALIRSLAPLIENSRSLRLWILGDGRERAAIYEILRNDGLHSLVAMPGIFTDLEQVLQAADLCIFPVPNRGLGWLLPTCLASSIPVLVSDCAEARSLLGEQARELSYDSRQPDELRNRVAKWLREPQALLSSLSDSKRAVGSPGQPIFGCDDLFHNLESRA